MQAAVPGERVVRDAVAEEERRVFGATRPLTGYTEMLGRLGPDGGREAHGGEDGDAEHC